MRPQVGQVINNKYRLLRLIGDGGMGSVYEARHEVLGTSVALKFLHPELTRRQGLVQRFLQEAKVSAQIQSPHVVRVTDVDQTTTGLAFIVLEFLEGRTLQTLYEDLYRAGQRLSYADALEYAMQMLEGVEAAHRTGIVHRDLKPDNVMVTKGPKGAPLLKLLDFGIAKLKVTGELDRGLTRPGVIMGTPEYMAPEQAYSADAVDARADIFSLAVMIFEMLAGRRPVGGDDPQQIASSYLSGQVAKLGDLVPGIAPELAAAVHRAMSPLPKDRFASVAELRDALEPFAHAVRGPMVSHPSNPGIGPTPAPSAVTPHVAAGPSPMAVAPATNLPMEAPRAVPKTLPPEADIAVGLAATAPAPQLGGQGVPGTRPWAGEPAQPIPGPGPQNFGGTPPGLAPTATNPPYQPNGGATNFAAPLDFSQPARASGTAVGAPYNGNAGVPAYGGTGTAPPGQQPYGAIPDTAKASQLERGRREQSGPPLLLILLLAGGIAGAVVGGLYIANRMSKVDDNGPAPIAAAPSSAVKSDPPPSDQPSAPLATAKSPVVTNTAKAPWKSSGSTPTPGPGPSQQPSAQPTAPDPPILPTVLVIPSVFPTFPFPPGLGPIPQLGQPQQQPQQPPPANTSPAEQPPPANTSPPAPTSPRTGPILRPRH